MRLSVRSVCTEGRYKISLPIFVKNPDIVASSSMCSEEGKSEVSSSFPLRIWERRCRVEAEPSEFGSVSQQVL